MDTLRRAVHVSPPGGDGGDGGPGNSGGGGHGGGGGGDDGALSLSQRLHELAEARDAGLVSEEEFQAARRRVITIFLASD